MNDSNGNGDINTESNSINIDNSDSRYNLYLQDFENYGKNQEFVTSEGFKCTAVRALTGFWVGKIEVDRKIDFTKGLKFEKNLVITNHPNKTEICFDCAGMDDFIPYDLVLTQGKIPIPLSKQYRDFTWVKSKLEDLSKQIRSCIQNYEKIIIYPVLIIYENKEQNISFGFPRIDLHIFPSKGNVVYSIKLEHESNLKMLDKKYEISFRENRRKCPNVNGKSTIAGVSYTFDFTKFSEINPLDQLSRDCKEVGLKIVFEDETGTIEKDIVID